MVVRGDRAAVSVDLDVPKGRKSLIEFINEGIWRNRSYKRKRGDPRKEAKAKYSFHSSSKPISRKRILQPVVPTPFRKLKPFFSSTFPTKHSILVLGKGRLKPFCKSYKYSYLLGTGSREKAAKKNRLRNEETKKNCKSGSVRRVTVSDQSCIESPVKTETPTKHENKSVLPEGLTLPKCLESFQAYCHLLPSETNHFEKLTRKGASNDVVATVSNAEITRKSFKRLRPGKWLDDEIINAYLKSLKVRNETVLCKTKGRSNLAVYFHKTYFYTKLTEGGRYTYSNVRTWTKRGPGKCDLFSQSMIFIPINIEGQHWALSVVFPTKKKIVYYDSLGLDGLRVLKNLRRYLSDEARDKGSYTMNTSEWSLVNKKSAPRQNNQSDCGAFVCAYCACLLFGWKLTFTSKSMSTFRKKIALEVYKISS
mmetsp:Transcript_12004/g.15563  ORF Transcript_12004/g.15563 Transcript_12004/m.15563 type:complete len:423 (+) Transcript_12004:82-1350(+)|eukprot:CAMPEP_0184017888 /NCGR_PEP_ID=MMETSP0954-20121128/7812_1 /TAXON_ID=627963 /ORGANISM="Aplanochytrium sp, Strain PBS07" /LENGTH=422 /DNA_ID=CAMNT_0026299225 /DNA_START=59 /DNA_END=1327 /DNA_ORIENTATION=-